VAYEIRYNKLSIFKTVYQSYISLGLLLLVLYIVGLFGTDSAPRTKVLRFIKVVLIAFSTLLFLYHGTGLGFRWFISGHAPWSNGYEAIVFIAWVTVLAGGLFMRKVEVALSVALILASMMLFVSELNLLDPEISPLVPVLKSYWLMIHVAIITSSYAFLGLSFILGLLNLCFYLFQHPKRGEKLSNHIQQITAVNEMTMTVGIFMLTIGTFLGGVWANESWGRYWGWDPKETWALVSILVYAIILHLRFIPGLKSPFTFNLWAFWGYSAILFTYFGVNFMLVGLHSYAQGDGLGSFPNWLIYTIIFFMILSILSYVKYRKSTQAA
jgi:cytochrome c-type biogenesis protein CcsB